MAYQDSSILPWRYQDIDFSRVDRSLIADDEDLFFLLCASSFIESGSDLYTSNLASFFDGDSTITDWLNQHWESEELQHGRALKAYIQAVWPDFDWDLAFQRFFDEYSRTCTVEEFEKTRALEMAARCVVETGTATLYRAISDFAREPVLKELTGRIRADEVRHYKHFYQYFREYNAREGNSRWTVLRALLRRVLEIKNDDAEIALRHAFAIRYPDAPGGDARLKAMTSRVSRMVRRNLSAEMCVKMLLKPLDLPARIAPTIQYPLEKITQHVFFR
jgi:hypothetical protein